ncbi:MAG: zinc finger domain-containing protein [Candidatus Micrarchaeia archaeon]
MPELTGKVCSSCGRLTNDYTEFKCPKCGSTTIVRCRDCRENFHTYKCEACGFEGP